MAFEKLRGLNRATSTVTQVSGFFFSPSKDRPLGRNGSNVLIRIPSDRNQTKSNAKILEERVIIIRFSAAIDWFCICPKIVIPKHQICANKSLIKEIS